MTKIELSSGYSTLVDAEDFEWLSQWKWSAMIIRKKNFQNVYAYRNRRKADGAGPIAIFIHRVLVNAPKGLIVDHINHDSLDNRRANLRLGSTAQNNANNRRARGGTGYRGVTVDQRDGAIFAQCRGYLGRFKTVEDAARAYDDAARAHFGEFATLNFP